MNKLLISFGIMFLSLNSFGDSIFVVGEPYYRGPTDYEEKDECIEKNECVEFAWYHKYKIKNVKVLSGNVHSTEISFVMATHEPRYTNGDRRQKWYVELVPVSDKQVVYKAIDWYPISEVVCTRMPLTFGSKKLALAIHHKMMNRATT